MKNINKKLIAVSVIFSFILATTAFVWMADVKAQSDPEDNGQTAMTQADQEAYENIRNGLSGIMESYGMVQTAPEINREDWMAMHGEIYDLMTENGVNPGTAMMYMYGHKTMQKDRNMNMMNNW